MMLTNLRANRAMRWIGLSLAGSSLATTGCGGFTSSNLNMLGIPVLFGTRTGDTGTGDGTVTDPGAGGGDGFFGGVGSGTTDPCLEPDNRKFINISMRNNSDDIIHYFVAFVAFVDTDTQLGAVCQDDLALYTNFGYQFIAEGAERSFGDYCVQGPALLYFHENGNFQNAGGTFASAIDEAQGTNPTFDSFFGPGGAVVPVPNQILFHNPGTGEGAALSVAPINPNPCEFGLIVATQQCSLDAFYYVDNNDLPAGSTALGPGSARRTPNEIQGTGCTTGFNEAFHSLAPPGITGSTAGDNEFIRGGSIEFVFIREDVTPPVPQLLWRVTDDVGGIVHEFDPRAPL